MSELKINLDPIIHADIKNISLSIKKELALIEGKNILITGASGMLASYIIYTLLYANEKLFKKKAHLYLVMRSKKKPFGVTPYVHYLNQDISNDQLILPSQHFIIHAASKSAPKVYTHGMIDTLNANIKGAYNTLQIINSETKSFLFFSSGEIYGQPKTNKPIDESYIGCVNHLNQRSCYVEGKRAAETICMNYFLERKYPIKIVRILHTFGPGLNLHDGRIFSDFIKDGLEKKDIEINGDRRIKRALLYIADATIMFIKILVLGRNGEIYNVSNDKNIISVGDMAKTVCNIFNKKQKLKLKLRINIKKKNYYKNVVKHIALDISKFKKEFKYIPLTNVETAFTRTIDFYERNKNT